MILDLAELIINNPEAEIIATLQRTNPAEINFNEIDRFGFRPLIEAVICNKPKVLKFLLQQPTIDIEQQDLLGKTALQWAVERSNLDLCKILLENKANPNHYSLDGQPILVYPILREQLDLVELLKKHQANHLFAQDFISAKLLGHRFELTGETDIVSPEHKFIPLSFEGFYLEFSVGLIARSLFNFINSIDGQNFNDLQGKLHQILIALKNASILASFAKHKDKTLFIATIDNILKEPLLLIPSAYSGHAITFIKYKNYLAKCDRGVSNITDTVIIYEVGNKYLLNNKFFYKLLYEPKTDNFINYEFKEELSLTPIKSLPTRNQIAGNCSFANVETSVPAMLYLLFNINDPKIAATAEAAAFNFYKHWIEWDQDSALNEIIADFHNAKAERQISKATTIGAILVQRCNKNIKKHLERAKKIINILMIPNFQFILRNYIIVYNKTSAGKTGKNIISLLNSYGLSQEDFKNLVLNKPLNFNNKKTIISHDNNITKMTTALHVACLSNKTDTVEYLINKLKIDVNYLDRTGSTPLMYAAWKGHLNLVKLLVTKYNANIKIKNLKNGTAEKYASLAGHTQIVKFLKQHN